MASRSSPEASEIRRRGRRRLLGAVTLVLLVVVFVPMFLDSEPRPTRSDPSLVIPPQEKAPPLPPPVPAATPAPAPQASAPAPAPTQAPAQSPTPSAPAQAPAPAATAAPSAPAPAAAQVEVAPAKKPEAATAKKPEPAPAAEPAKPASTKAPAAPKLEGFAVQVGAFRDEARLKQARQKLEAAHVVHYVERVETKGGTITRLRAGPFKTREAAEKVRASLKDGKVVPLP